MRLRSLVVIICQKLGRSSWALALSVVLVAGIAKASDQPTEDAGEPGNIVIVLMDDVGVDKLSVYGRHPLQPHTPNINSFARESAVFRAAYSQPTCTPTRASIMTGRFGRRTGHGVMIGSGDEIPLDAIFITEVLAGARKPYESSAVGKWHMAGTESQSRFRHPLLQGFGWYAGAYGNLVGESEGYFNFLKTVYGGEAVMTRRYATSDTVNDAIVRMNAMRPPWFLYVSFNAAHNPFHHAPAWLRTSADDKEGRMRRYESMIEAIDHEFGRLLAGIPKNQARQTTVFLLSDNGAPETRIRLPFNKDRGKSTVYEGGIHVPLIVKGPAVAAPEIERNQLVHVVDLFPTIAELAGVRIGHEIDGVSFAPALRDPKVEGRSVVYSDRFAPNGPPPYAKDVRMIRDRHWKLIRRSPLPDVPDGLEAEEFFAMRPDQIDEGPNLLLGPLTPDAEAGYQSLAAALDRISAGLTYEGPASEPRKSTLPSGR